MSVPFVTTLLLAAAFALQPTGAFHGDEPVARDGEPWLALRLRGDDAALVPVHARVRKVHDVVLDADDGPPSGLEVSAAGMPDAALLLRGPGLRAGRVDAAVMQPAAPNAFAGPLRLGGHDYRLEPRCPDGDKPATCEIVLVQGAISQPIFHIEISLDADGRPQYGSDASPSLLFAGDLDHDGRLDLILDTTDHYNVSRPVLLLSSRARRGELVREVAEYSSVGC